VKVIQPSDAVNAEWLTDRATSPPTELWLGSAPVTLHTYSPMKMEETECSETLAFKLQTPGNNPEKAYDKYVFASIKVLDT
jgi:hypothetical protein